MVDSVWDLLPIGTVVSVLGVEKRLMIFGILQDLGDNAEEEGRFDYSGVPYPEGNIAPDYQVLFHHEDIVEVFFRGFEDIERQHFIKALSESEDGDA